MKKTTKTGVVLLSTLLISTAFTLRETSNIQIDKFGQN